MTYVIEHPVRARDLPPQLRHGLPDDEQVLVSVQPMNGHHGVNVLPTENVGAETRASSSTRIVEDFAA